MLLNYLFIIKEYITFKNSQFKKVSSFILNEKEQIILKL